MYRREQANAILALVAIGKWYDTFGVVKPNVDTQESHLSFGPHPETRIIA